VEKDTNERICSEGLETLRLYLESHPEGKESVCKCDVVKNGPKLLKGDLSSLDFLFFHQFVYFVCVR
jgi:hypothetical protein